MRQTLLALSLFLVVGYLDAKSLKKDISNPFKSHFDEAYQLFPTIERGILEAVAYTNTRFTHLKENEAPSCIGMPKAYGVMGLIENGQGYFRNNLITVSELSSYSVEEMKSDARKSILAYAKAFSVIRPVIRGPLNYYSSEFPEAYKLYKLSELPTNTTGETFAFETQLYSILSFLNDPDKAAKFNFTVFSIDLKKVFGEENYKILSASHIVVSEREIKNSSGDLYKNSGGNEVQSPDYGPALWTAAATCNYSVGRSAAVSAVTIHFVQGSYAGCISWFQNCAASVSAHYVVRSSDGQITQMVLESNTGWHVGNQNSYTVGIEHEGYVSQPSWYTVAMYQSSAALSADICASHGIDPGRTGYWPWMPTTYYNASSIPGSCTHVKGHMHYPNQSHTDPGQYWDWEYYYKLINPAPAAISYTAASGTFYDSGGPTGNYVDDERTVWTIAPTNATTVSLTVNNLNIENTWDYLFIYDGNDVWSPLIGLYTGTNSPGTVTSTGGVITVEFRSDCSANQTGWNANWTSNASAPPSNLNVLASTCPQIDVTFNWTNTGNGWYIDVSTDPNFTTFFNKNVSNLVTESCPGGFCDFPSCTNYLKFEPGTTYYWRIWDGNAHTLGQNFTTPVCTYADNNCNGSWDDTGGPSGAYAGNEDYTFTISPTNATSVTINFNSFDLELNYDSLYIYDGASISSPLLGAYTGTNSPGQVTSTGGSMTVHFISDPFVENAGFTSTWTCTQLSTGIPENENGFVNVFPNPFSGSATLEMDLAFTSDVQIRLYSVLGNLLHEHNADNVSPGKFQYLISTADLGLASGVYFLSVQSGKYIQSIRLVIE